MSRDRSRIDCAGSLKRAAKQLRLRIGPVFTAGTAAKIGLAGQHELADALRTAEAVQGLERIDHRGRPEFSDLVAMRVVARRERGQIAMLVRHAKALAEILNQLHAALFVPNMLRPFRLLINGGEDPAEAATRECLEETGLRVRVTRVLEIISGREHPRGADFIIVYQAEPLGGELKPDDDADAVEWFARDQLPPLAFRATKKVLQSFYD